MIAGPNSIFSYKWLLKIVKDTVSSGRCPDSVAWDVLYRGLLILQHLFLPCRFFESIQKNSCHSSILIGLMVQDKISSKHPNPQTPLSFYYNVALAAKLVCHYNFHMIIYL